MNSAGTDYRAFFYDASTGGAKTMIDVFSASGIVTGPSYSYANGINDSGQLTGSFVGSDGNSYLYIGNANTGAFGAWGFGAGSAIIGNGINNLGHVVGTAYLPGDAAGTLYAFSFNPDSSVITLLPDPTSAYGSGNVFYGNAINGSDVFVGTYAASSTSMHMAFYCDGINGYPIPTPADTSTTVYFAEANGINATGQVVGGAVMTSSAQSFHAYRFDIFTGGNMVDLGTVGSGAFSEAQGINTSGQIVGWSTITTDANSPIHAFVYNSSGGMSDLNSLIPASSGWTQLVEATAINDSGWIVGDGVNSAGATDGFLLKPVPLGDANGDGKVDINDLTIVQANYGKTTGMTWQTGDFNGDGKVDINDLTIIQTNYLTNNGSSLAAVPEPSSFLMLAVATLLPAAGWGIARRRTRRR